MSIWSAKKRAAYISGAFLFFLIFIVLPVFLLIYRAPTCSDGKQNQGETGIDCGGPCKMVCQSVAIPPVVLWQRFFPIGIGVYNAVARIENPNLNYAVTKAKYIFNLYDKANVVIMSRQGETNIPAHKIFYIFEGSLNTGERAPIKATFEFIEPLSWVSEKAVSPLTVSGQNLTKISTVPRLEAILNNNSDSIITNVEVVAVIFDAEGNAVNASKTIVDLIKDQSSLPIFFTWRLPFEQEPARAEIIPKTLGQ